MFYSSPVSNITPALASVAMSRSDSRDSTNSGPSFSHSQPTTSAYASLALSTTSTWPTSAPHLVRSDSNSSSSSSAGSVASMLRRDASSTWQSAPYRSCLETCASQSSSYLSDDDLLYIAPPSSLRFESIPNLEPKKELTTEEQIAMYREQHEKEHAAQQCQQSREAERKRVVRFAGTSESKTRRSSTLRRKPANNARARLHLNGPQ